MKKFEGKNLLILGNNVGSIDMLKYAKSNGARVIAVDNI